MKPEERVRIAVGMTEVVMAICIDSIKDREGELAEEALIAEARRRIMHGRRLLKGV